MPLIERAWFGDGPVSRVAGVALAPLGWSFAAVVAARNALYDRGLFAADDAHLPALSVGNLSVGGTGKTPVAAWAAARLAERGAHPAVVMRGYGNDEPLVHARLNPGVPVIADADRVRGMAAARAAGARRRGRLNVGYQPADSELYCEQHHDQPMKYLGGVS